jgi:precorrin-6A/cobalt-precorrin-6A reductase
MKRLLILGGTGDATKLTSEASQLSGVEIIYSLAGRTRKPSLPDCETRIGGFGGADGLAAYMNDAKIDLVIDATHPFAENMAAHAAEACTKTSIPRLKFCRTPWVSGDISWQSINTYAEAAAALSTMGDRVFLSIGTKDLDAFSGLSDKWFFLRAVEEPALPVPLLNHGMLLERGPFDEGHERTLMVTYQIDVLVSKNSGGTMAAKLQAAHDLNIPIVMIEQPAMLEGEVVGNVKDTVDWLTRHL